MCPWIHDGSAIPWTQTGLEHGHEWAYGCGTENRRTMVIPSSQPVRMIDFPGRPGGGCDRPKLNEDSFRKVHSPPTSTRCPSSGTNEDCQGHGSSPTAGNNLGRSLQRDKGCKTHWIEWESGNWLSTGKVMTNRNAKHAAKQNVRGPRLGVWYLRLFPALWKRVFYSTPPDNPLPASASDVVSAPRCYEMTGLFSCRD